jgi:hypothetical protein
VEANNCCCENGLNILRKFKEANTVKYCYCFTSQAGITDPNSAFHKGIKKRHYEFTIRSVIPSLLFLISQYFNINLLACPQVDGEIYEL